MTDRAPESSNSTYGTASAPLAEVPDPPRVSAFTDELATLMARYNIGLDPDGNGLADDEILSHDDHIAASGTIFIVPACRDQVIADLRRVAARPQIFADLWKEALVPRPNVVTRVPDSPANALSETRVTSPARRAFSDPRNPLSRPPDSARITAFANEVETLVAKYNIGLDPDGYGLTRLGIMSTEDFMAAVGTLFVVPAARDQVVPGLRAVAKQPEAFVDLWSHASSLTPVNGEPTIFRDFTKVTPHGRFVVIDRATGGLVFRCQLVPDFQATNDLNNGRLPPVDAPEIAAWLDDKHNAGLFAPETLGFDYFDGTESRWAAVHEVEFEMLGWPGRSIERESATQIIA